MHSPRVLYVQRWKRQVQRLAFPLGSRHHHGVLRCEQELTNERTTPSSPRTTTMGGAGVIHGAEVAPVGDLALVAGELPGPALEQLLLCVEQCPIGVDVRADVSPLPAGTGRGSIATRCEPSVHRSARGDGDHRSCRHVRGRCISTGAAAPPHRLQCMKVRFSIVPRACGRQEHFTLDSRRAPLPPRRLEPRRSLHSSQVSERGFLREGTRLRRVGGRGPGSRQEGAPCMPCWSEAQPR